MVALGPQYSRLETLSISTRDTPSSKQGCYGRTPNGSSNLVTNLPWAGRTNSRRLAEASLRSLAVLKCVGSNCLSHRFPTLDTLEVGLVLAPDARAALLPRLPLPLSQLLRRALNAKTPLERHLTGYYLWECSLKLLGSAAVVDYAELADPDPAL